MPIIDYDEQVKKTQKWFFNNTDISDTNKQYVKDYINYHITKGNSPARISIVLRQIRYLLERTEDIKEVWNDKNKINNIFADIRNISSIGDATFGTILNVSLAFVRWLYDNEGSKPAGFKDISNLPKSKQRKKLNPSQMITWEDITTKCFPLIKDVQFQAMLSVALDGGFRPSELMDIKLNQITIDSPFIRIYVSKTKTGKEKDVILFKSVPYLSRWLSSHPLKDKNSYLWIQDKRNKEGQHIGYKPYKYHAYLKRIKDIFKKAEINKPVSQYMFRHSSAVMKKRDNLNDTQAANMMGHDIKMYQEVYGRLSIDDKKHALSKAYGLIEEKEENKNPITCKRCKTSNPANSFICEVCNTPLSVEAAIKIKEDRETKQELIINKMIEEKIKLIYKNNKKV